MGKSSLVIALLLLAAPSHAGYTYQGMYCYKGTDGTGACMGTFAAYRNAADTTTYAYFGASTAGSGFYAVYNNQQFSCTVSTGSTAMLSLWPSMASTLGYFYVSWSGTGLCNYASSSQGSLYSNF